MTTPFVWFDNFGSDRGQTTQFFEKTFNWGAKDIGSMTFLIDGDGHPFAANCDEMTGISGWVPYIEVDELSAAVNSASSNGAKTLAENLVGPAGTATFMIDPGGSAFALWKRGADA